MLLLQDSFPMQKIDRPWAMKSCSHAEAKLCRSFRHYHRLHRLQASKTCRGRESGIYIILRFYRIYGSLPESHESRKSVFFPFPKTKATKSVPRETWKVCAAKDPTSIVVWFCLCGRTVQKVQHEFRMNSEYHKWLQRNAADSSLCNSKWHYTTQHRTSPSERCLRRCTAIVTL